MDGRERTKQKEEKEESLVVGGRHGREAGRERKKREMRLIRKETRKQSHRRQAGCERTKFRRRAPMRPLMGKKNKSRVDGQSDFSLTLNSL